MDEDAQQLSFEDPLINTGELDFGTKLSETCWLLYNRFMNHPNVKEGKYISLLVLLFCTFILGFILAIFRGMFARTRISGRINFPMIKEELNLFIRPNNLIMICVLVTLGYITIETGVVAVPWMQYVDAANNLDDAELGEKMDIEEGPGTYEALRNMFMDGLITEESFRRRIDRYQTESLPRMFTGLDEVDAARISHCRQNGYGPSQVESNGSIISTSFIILIIIWSTLYLIWLVGMVLFINPTKLGGKSATDVFNYLNKKN